jgi:hypothetical protein
VGLAVAVGAEEGEVLEAVVVALAVAVVQFERQLLVAPLRDATFLAAALLEACGDQADLDVPTAATTFDQQVVEWHGLWTRDKRTSIDCISPCGRRKPELLHALADGVPLVVIALNCVPVIAQCASIGHGISELALVVADRRLVDAEHARDLVDPLALLEQLTYAIPSSHP